MPTSPKKKKSLKAKSDQARAKFRQIVPRGTGALVIVGGKEDRVGDRKILCDIARRVKHGTLAIITGASEIPHEVYEDYSRIFKDLGVKQIKPVHISHPEDARNPKIIAALDDAAGVYFTGGDQLKLTTKIGGSPLFDRVLSIYFGGGVVAGTSAGAAVMGEMMLVGSENTESHKVGNWMMAPGFGFVKNMIVDQHFAQRGRMGRLLGAIAQNPSVIGIGIDEDTAVIVEDSLFRVLGTNAVYIVDGRFVSHSNIAESSAELTMSLHNVRLHVLAEGDVFDVKTHEPTPASGKGAKPREALVEPRSGPSSRATRARA